MLVGRFTIRLQSGDQSAQSWREHDQITGILSRSVSVGDPRRHEYRRTRSRSLSAAGITKSQLAFQNVPCFVVGMVDVKRGRAAAAPLMDRERSSSCREAGG